MDQYKFHSYDSSTIVNAIVEGYRDYIEHRKERHCKMKISSAFAWTKGNFIESKIAEISENLNLSYKKAKAGLTWDYLQFIHGESKKLFLIKNAAYFNENSFSQAVLPNNSNIKGSRRTYLHELSKINKDLDFTTTTTSPINTKNHSEQLTLFISEDQVKDELNHFQSTYHEFRILTYKIDEAYQISEIMHYLPNPENNIAYKIEDLSEYITGAELSDEEREVIAPEQENDIIDPAAFDIGIFKEEQSN
ncbi:spr1630 family ClpXP-sensitive toxin [Paucisalibacillus globulus]|uniref:spr1630 family ClpXP-sensitive toxin n=1 Tax=Paucisalibacillus globulus TaxID=351095 RepID=UPI000BB940FA|nr:hypothetical protein [Paucisalibacillus globulus]